jgi:hypothetical protein
MDLLIVERALTVVTILAPAKQSLRKILATVHPGL